jgi:hypothetical protein
MEQRFPLGADEGSSNREGSAKIVKKIKIEMS